MVSLDSRVELDKGLTFAEGAIGTLVYVLARYHATSSAGTLAVPNRAASGPALSGSSGSAVAARACVASAELRL